MKNEREGKRGTEGSILDPDTAPEDKTKDSVHDDLLEVTEDEH